ncbi:MAG: hypothetical protein QGG58_04615 [Chloroflexota bacterium]|jgi:hypothetical protein|nr:hypothetical protein [Chloroflexota bacterium]
MQGITQTIEHLGGVSLLGDDDHLPAGVDRRTDHEGGDVMGDGFLVVGYLPLLVVVDPAAVVLALPLAPAIEPQAAALALLEAG